MPDSSDRALVLRVRGGDSDAFGDLVQRYQTSVYNVCFRLLGEAGAAEDQAQEAFIRAYQRLDQFDAERPFGPWVRRGAANPGLNPPAGAPPPPRSPGAQSRRPAHAAPPHPPPPPRRAARAHTPPAA